MIGEKAKEDRRVKNCSKRYALCFAASSERAFLRHCVLLGTTNTKAHRADYGTLRLQLETDSTLGFQPPDFASHLIYSIGNCKLTLSVITLPVR